MVPITVLQSTTLLALRRAKKSVPVSGEPQESSSDGLAPKGRLFRRMEAVSHAVACAGAAAILVFAVLTITDVVLRNLFAVTITGLNVVLILILGVAISACMPFGFLAGKNLSVDILSSLLSENVRAALLTAASLILLVFVSILGIEIWLFAMAMHARGQTTLILGWMASPFFFAMAGFILICAPIQAFNMLRAAAVVFGTRSPLGMGVLVSLVLSTLAL